MRKMAGIIIVIIISCSNINDNIQFENDDYEIYELLINGFLENRKKSFVVIREKTKISSLRNNDNSYSKRDKEFVLDKFGIDYDYLFNDYWIKNKRSYKLNTFINSHEQYMTYSELIKIMKKYIKGNNIKGRDAYFWNIFRKIDPEICGIITFSKIGFNNERNEAILEVEYLFGNMGLEIDYVVLRKNKRWEIIKQYHYIMG
jgi:hypothetical protein